MALNIKTQAARKKFFQEGNRLPEEIAQGSNIETFCRNLGGDILKCGSHELLLLHSGDGDERGKEIFLKRKNLLIYSGRNWPRDSEYLELFDVEGFEESLKKARNWVPSAALVRCSGRMPQGFKLVPLLNADTSEATYCPEYELVDEYEGENFPVVSFSALSRFYDDDFSKLTRQISEGNLRLRDYTPDEKIKFTDEEKKQARRKKPQLTPPSPGYTALNGGWHRPGFCLFTDDLEGLCLLTGQDEGSYFVVELPKKATTVEKALDILIPEEARVPGVQRQGEWFFVPCEEEDVPSVAETVLLFDTRDCCGCNGGYYGDQEYGCVFMPLDDPESNKHSLMTRDGRVGKDGYLYVRDVSVEHTEHATLEVPGWSFAVKNTALRSYSESGVD